MHETDTIAALATPPGEGAIGIIRVSGPRSREIAHRLFRKKKGRLRLETHRLQYGYIVDPERDEHVDEVLLAWMERPHTYTREDVLEIQCHSGPAVLERILDLVFQSGARPAEPGEFTKRAFLNGRIDLARAEAVIDVVRAQTREALSVSSRQLEGALSTGLSHMEEALADLLARVEVAIDFPEEDVEILAPEEAVPLIEQELLPAITRLVDSFHTGRLFREGAYVVIAGRPNVGKSSLLNRLVQRNRAIVTPYPGTTRDSLEETIHIAGIPVRIVDTAGIRETRDEIEKISLETTRSRIDQADLVLFVVDLSCDPGEEDEAVYRAIREKPLVVVANKLDLWKGGEHPVDRRFSSHTVVRVSALKEIGMEDLKNAMARILVRPGTEPGSQVMLTRLRHKNALEACANHLQRAVTNLKGRPVLDTLAADLQWALEALHTVTGRNVPEEILDRIFSRFCIGK